MRLNVELEDSRDGYSMIPIRLEADVRADRVSDPVAPGVMPGGGVVLGRRL